MVKGRKAGKETVLYSALFLLLIFFDFMELYVPLANYWDELAACIVLCWGGWHFLKNPSLRKDEFISWALLLVLVGIGVLGNILHPGLQTEHSVFFRDVVALCKFPAIFFLLSRRTVPAEKQRRIICNAAAISRWIVAVTLIAAVVGYFVEDLGFYNEEVRVLRGFQFVFSHPTFFVSSYVILAAAMMAESIDKNKVFLLLTCLLLFLAQRTKGYVFVVFCVLLILLGEDRTTKILTAIFGSGKEKIKLSRILLVVAAVGLTFLLLSRSKIELYLQLGMNAPRLALYIVGLKILMDFFPLGSGLGTFASYLSGENYSKIYSLYGVDQVVCMTESDYSCISDTFWPYIYGQFGVFGLLIYVKLLLDIFARQYCSRLPKASRIALAAVWLYALIASTSEAYFTNGTGVQVALFLTMFIGYSGENTEASQQAGKNETEDGAL